MSKRVERITFCCEYCGSEVIERVLKYSRRKRFNCLKRECINKSKAHSGESNGMYGKTHTEEVKQAASERAKQQFTGKSYEEICGIEKAIELKRKRSEVFKSIPKRCGKENSFFGKRHSKETLLIISQKSVAKFTDEYWQKIYQTNYESGLWRHPDLKEDIEIYNKESDWIERMFNFLSEDNIKKLNEIKIFNAKTNSKGLVRDHKFSRMDGFNLKVFPEILRHPCNLQIITHSKNISKGSKSSISLEQLFEDIKNFNGDWIENDLVLSLIGDYQNGKRWQRKFLSENNSIDVL